MTVLEAVRPVANVDAMPVFPAADIFPMLPDEELAELAADIKENGLHEPLVIAEVPNADGELIDMLVDGRNRRAACKLAGIKPTVRRLNGEDATAYVLSANIHRRHLRKGQRAIATAMLKPEQKMGRNAASAKLATELGVSSELLRRARIVLAYSRPLADRVLAGQMPLNDAYEQAQRFQNGTETVDTRRERIEQEAPDVAAFVNDGTLTLEAAETEVSKRREILRNKRDTAMKTMREAIQGLNAFASESFYQFAAECWADPVFRGTFTQTEKINRAACERGFARLQQILESEK